MALVAFLPENSPQKPASPRGARHLCRRRAAVPCRAFGPLCSRRPGSFRCAPQTERASQKNSRIFPHRGHATHICTASYGTHRQTAIITGGSSGIGLAIAQRFVQEGAYVFITGRRQAELDKAVAAIGRIFTAVQGDVAKLADLDRLYQTVAAQNRKIDIVVANAAVVDIVPTPAVTPELFEKPRHQRRAAPTSQYKKRCR